MNDNVLMFSYFKGHGDGLHLAFSEDGYRWEALFHDQVMLKPEAGIEKIMRDPCIIQGRDGVFHMVWTSGWTERGIGYAYSNDLIHWSEQQYLPVMEHEEKARNCWAPEIFYDQQNACYMIYWSSTIDGRFPETQSFGDDGYNHRIYYVTTRDFKSFSQTRLLYDRGFNVIDANIVQDGDRYIMFMKNETLLPPQKNLCLAIGNSPTEFQPPGAPITPPYYWAEGPSAVKLGDHWVVYFDKYRINQIGAVCSQDLVHWSDISDKITFPAGAQHGYVFKTSRQVLNNIIHTTRKTHNILYRE